MDERRGPVSIGDLQAAIDRGVSFWAMPIVAALESQYVGRAFDFAVTLVGAQLAGRTGGNLGVKRKWLADVIRIRRNAAAASGDLGRLSREIWYFDLARDSLQTSISRLYAALADFFAGDDLGYRRQVAMVVAIFASDPSGRPVPGKLAELRDYFLQGTL